MGKLIKMVGLFVLIGFSFFYSDKVIEVIKSEDKIMIELKEVEDEYKVLPIDATILGNTIVPGISGKNINIDESYKNMKVSGLFNKNLIVYDTILPSISINDNKDKFIIRGNSNKGSVGIIFILDSDLYFDKINEIFNSKEVIANYFVDYNYLINNSTKIKETINHEFYSYGNKGEYTPDNLLFSNNLISRIKSKDAKYCLTDNMSNKVLELCSKNNLYTISPSIIGDISPYITIKENLVSGSVILLNMNSETISELSTIIDYIKGKGLKIEGLSKVLSEV